MVILDTILPDFGFEEARDFSKNGAWHFSFHSVRVAEEKMYILTGSMIGLLIKLQ